MHSNNLNFVSFEIKGDIVSKQEDGFPHRNHVYILYTIQKFCTMYATDIYKMYPTF